MPHLKSLTGLGCSRGDWWHVRRTPRSSFYIASRWGRGSGWTFSCYVWMRIVRTGLAEQPLQSNHTILAILRYILRAITHDRDVALQRISLLGWAHHRT